MQQVLIPQEEPGLLEKATDYAETQLMLLKYKTIDSGAEIASSLVTKMVVLILCSTFILILNIGVALWLGTLLGASYFGFFAVAAVYGLAAFLLYIFRQSWLKKPLNDVIIKKLLKPKP